MKTSLYAPLLLLSTALMPALPLRAEVTLPHILSDGMVLQRGDTLRLWGSADAGERVDVRFRGRKYHTTADEAGRWLLLLPPQKAGGPYELSVGQVTLHDVYVGDVWLTSGQSNMDLPVSRVADLYAAETDTATNERIHLIQIATRSLPDAPREDLGGTERWEALRPEQTGHWSAVSYFFARAMYAATGVPQGVINSSQGGSAIEGWMSREAISAVSERDRQELDFCLTPGYMERCKSLNGAINRSYNELMNTQDPGFKENWMNPELNDEAWDVAGTRQSEIGSVGGRAWRGTLWFRYTFEVPDSLVGREGLLRLGCLVDADQTYINGRQVGTTGYQYPPRKYRVPADLLHAGRNVLCIRLTTGGAATKFVENKPYQLELGEAVLQLPPTEYRYRRGAMMPAQPGVPSFDNLATGYYNGMIAPLLPYHIAGIIWYQGETNTGRPGEYQTLLEALAADWRKGFGRVPLMVVQLAGFMQRHAEPTASNWAALRDAQRRAATTIPTTGLATAIDLGESNDIHPLRKKPLGERLALLARRLYLGDRKVVAEGPSPLRATVVAADDVRGTAQQASGATEVRITFRPETDALETYETATDKNTLRTTRTDAAIEKYSFAIAGADGRYRWAAARVTGPHEVTLTCPEGMTDPQSVRYAWDDFPVVSLYGVSGLPAPSFEVKVE